MNNRFSPTYIVIFLMLLCFAPAVKAQYRYDQEMLSGYRCMQSHDYDKAQKYFRNAAKSRPQSEEPYLYMALVRAQLEDYPGAEASLDSALQRRPYMPLANVIRGYTRYYQGKDSLALLDAEAMLAHNPYERDALQLRCITLARLDRHQEAVEALTQFKKQARNPEDVYAMRASSYLALADTTAALADVDSALNLAPLHVNAHLIRCDVLCKRQQWEEAAADMDEVINQLPQEYKLYLNRSYIRYNNKNYRGAMADLNTAISMRPDMPEALYNRGLLAFEVKDLDLAASDFSEVLRLQPDNFPALLNRAMVYMEDGKYRLALQDMDRIVAKYPRFYPVYYMMAEANLHLGNQNAYFALVRKAEDMVRNYVDNPKKYRLDRPVIDPGSTNASDMDNNGELTEEEVIERYNQMVTAAPSSNVKMNFAEQMQGLQRGDVSAAPEPACEVGPLCDVLAKPLLFRSLDELNKRLPELLPYPVHNAQTGPILEDERVLRLPYPKVYVTVPMDLSDESIEDIKVAIDSVGKMTDANHNQALVLYRAAMCNTVDRPDWALLYANEVLQQSPDNVVALLIRADAYSRQYRMQSVAKDGIEPDEMMKAALRHDLLDKAQADLDRVVQLDDSAATAWYNKGCIYFETGDLSSALNCFTNALQLHPEFAEAYFNRGLTYLRMGNRTEGVSDLRRAGEYGLTRAYSVMKRF